MDKNRRANFLRKLHSFAGVFPLGIFLCFHMCVNYSANWGTAPYNTMGSFMAHMPYKIVLETFVIFLPLLFHASFCLCPHYMICVTGHKVSSLLIN